MKICANESCTKMHNNKTFCSNKCRNSVFKSSQRLQLSENFHAKRQQISEASSNRRESVTQDMIDEFRNLSYF